MNRAENSRKAVLCLLAASAFLALSGLLFAQADRATIEGIVTDSSGAGIVDARIMITRVETNIPIELKSNEAGRYFAANLPVGTYRVRVEKEGFRAAVVDNIILQSQM